MRSVVLVGLALACGGCLNWQGTYDAAARKECRRIINMDDRRDCLASVEANAYDKRAEQRRTGSE